MQVPATEIRVYDEHGDPAEPPAGKAFWFRAVFQSRSGARAPRCAYFAAKSVVDLAAWMFSFQELRLEAEVSLRKAMLDVRPRGGGSGAHTPCSGSPRASCRWSNRATDLGTTRPICGRQGSCARPPACTAGAPPIIAARADGCSWATHPWFHGLLSRDDAEDRIARSGNADGGTIGSAAVR